MSIGFSSLLNYIINALQEQRVAMMPSYPFACGVKKENGNSSCTNLDSHDASKSAQEWNLIYVFHPPLIQLHLVRENHASCLTSEAAFAHFF